jgi:hypothetical protein
VLLDHQKNLQIEQIRAIEQSSKAYPNYHFSALDIEAYLDARAEHLKQNYQLDKSLTAAATWYSRLLTIIMVIAFIAGASTVLNAVENDNNTLNIFWILIVLLGFNTASLFIWLVLSVWSHSRVTSSNGKLFQHILTWLVSSSHTGGPSLAASKTWLEWQLGSRSGRWLLGSSVHLFWLCYLLGGLAMLSIALSTHQYDFVWGSTILKTNVFSAITGALSTPMDWLNLPRPSTADLLASQVGFNSSAQTLSSTADAIETRAVWGYFLIGCLAFYGIIPRIIAWLVCVAIRGMILKKQTLDLTSPYYLHLKKRWRDLSASSEIIDEETPHIQSQVLQQHHFSSKTLPLEALWLGLELSQTVRAYISQHELLNIVDKATTQQAMVALVKTQVPTILLVNGQKAPDRGMTRLLKDLVKTNPKVSCWMVCVLSKPTTQITPDTTDADQKYLIAWQGVANLLAIHTEHCAILEVANFENKDSGQGLDQDVKENLDLKVNDGR